MIRTEHMTFEEYAQQPGVNFSSLKRLAVSPLNFWYYHVRPNREKELPSKEQTFGTLLHKATLEPAKWSNLYARGLASHEFEGLLTTIEEIRAWIRQHGVTPKGQLKADVIAQALTIDANAPILQILAEDHAKKNEGKEIVSAPEYDRVLSCAKALQNEPHVAELINGAQFEVSVFSEFEGIPIKGRIDILKPATIGDIKTFSQKRDKSIDATVVDAIWYERYHHQACFYAHLLGFPKWKGETVLPFVESEEPHETRIKVLAPTFMGEANLYFESARLEMFGPRGLLKLYKEMVDEYGLGGRPWRSAQTKDDLMDSDLKALAYG